MQADVKALHGLLNKRNAEQITARVSKLELASAKTTAKDETEVTSKDADTHADVSAELLEDSNSLSSEVHELPTPTGATHPKGFKELRFRVNKFGGSSKEADFEGWLEDFFLEATAVGVMLTKPSGSLGS